MNGVKMNTENYFKFNKTFIQMDRSQEKSINQKRILIQDNSVKLTITHLAPKMVSKIVRNLKSESFHQFKQGRIIFKTITSRKS